VLLVAPELTTPAVIGAGGLVHRVFAWAPKAAHHNGMRDSWTHYPHVTGELSAAIHEPDPEPSGLYAAGGSVLVHSGRLRRLVVPPWLAPAAAQLAERYGVRVDVDPTPELPEAPPIGVDSILFRAALPDPIIDLLTAIPRPDRPMPREEDGRLLPRVAALPPWDPWGIGFADGMARVATALNLPVNYLDSYAVVEYLPGDSFQEHTDLYEHADSWDRTVSFSLLLSEPGKDFEGGEFEIMGEPMGLRRGDMIGFTSRTPHSVTPIVAGRRLVLIAFGEWRR
jgi:hypothetical protein